MRAEYDTLSIDAQQQWLPCPSDSLCMPVCVDPLLLYTRGFLCCADEILRRAKGLRREANTESEHTRSSADS